VTTAFSYAGGVHLDGIEDPIPSSDTGGLMYVKDAVQIISDANKFYMCYLCHTGGFWTLNSVAGGLTDEDSIYEDGSALYGGAIYAATTDVTITLNDDPNTAYINHMYANQGGFIYLIGQSSFDFTQYTVITDLNAVVSGGFLHFGDDGTGSGGGDLVNIDNVIFSDIHAYHPDGDDTFGGVFYFNTDTLLSVTFADIRASTFDSVSHGGFAYVTQLSDVDTVTLTIKENTDGSDLSYYNDFEAGTSGSFLYSDAKFMKLIIDQTTIYCDTIQTYATMITTRDSDLYKESPDSATRAGAIYVEDPQTTAGSEKVTVASTDNTFGKCWVCQEGGIYSLKNVKNAEETDSTYSQNMAINGGAIKCDACKIDITTTTFTEHYAIMGGTILFDNDGEGTFDDINLQDGSSYNNGGAIAAIQTSLEVISTTLVTIKNSNYLR
jgi:hypothetical protein